MSEPRRAHWLRENKANRYPRRLLCLDSEAAKLLDGPREHHRLRLAFATFDVIDRETLEPKRSEESAFVDAGELWDWVEQRTVKKERTVLFAHNLAYDLRLCRALEELPARGWRLDAFSLDSYRCWMRWRRDGRTLLMVDTVSFVGRALARVGDELHLPKPELPREGDSFELWLARCRADARLLRELVLRLLRWLETDDHGNFRMTGPAQASASFRHRHLKRGDLLVHEDEQALAAERRSAWTGRCEVWRHGAVDGPIVEWDFSLAYARIARDALLPVRLRGVIEEPPLGRVLELGRRFAVLCEVDVDVDEPTVPAERDGRILWPVGRFTSTLWDAELELALAAGARARVHRAWVYRRGPLLQEWATWILGELEGPNGQACPIARAVLKQWSRALIGRFGLRYPKWKELADQAEPALELVPFVSADDGNTGTWLRLGRQVLEQAEVEESPDSAPAVMAYVMMLARCRLWEAMRRLPAGSLLYVDTDSLLVDEAGDAALAELAGEPFAEGLRVKARYRRGTFWAPRQLELAGAHRVAGLPKSARRRSRRTWRAEVWEGAAEAIRRGRPSEVVVTERTIRLRARDHRRRHLAAGATAPYRLEQEPG